MIKKILMFAVVVAFSLSLIVAPAAASPEDNWRKDVPPPPYEWDIEFAWKPSHIWCGYYSGCDVRFVIDITMPPVPFPAEYSVNVGGRNLASNREIFFEESGEYIEFRTSFSRYSIPRPLPITLTLQAKGVEISVTEIIPVWGW